MLVLGDLAHHLARRRVVKDQFPGTGNGVKGDTAFHLSPCDEIGHHVAAPIAVIRTSRFIQQHKMIWTDLDQVCPCIFQPDIKFSAAEDLHGQQYLLVALERFEVPVLKLTDFLPIQAQRFPLPAFPFLFGTSLHTGRLSAGSGSFQDPA